MTTAEERHAAQMAAIKDRHQSIKDRFADRKETQIEIPEDARLNQLGLQTPYMDDLGRLWRMQRDGDTSVMRLVFDPSWLHPSSRWFPDKETAMAHAHVAPDRGYIGVPPDAPIFMGFDLGEDTQWTEAEVAAMKGHIQRFNDFEPNRIVTEPHLLEFKRVLDEPGVRETLVEWAENQLAPMHGISAMALGQRTEPAAPATQGEAMRTITSHIVNPVSDKLKITVLDAAGPGGANHVYGIQGMDLERNKAAMETDNSNLPDDMMAIIFQCGGIVDHGVNGVTQEALLAIVADRLESFQAGPFACRENGEALAHVKAAQAVLQSRPRARMAQGVEGIEKPHVDPTDTQAANGNPAHE